MPTNDEALKHPAEAESDDDTEQISLEDADKVSGGSTFDPNDIPG